MNDKFDDALFSILTETKTLQNFLDVVFGFLNRRTDFYHVSDDRSLGIGFPEGVAESILIQSFKKYKQDEIFCLSQIQEEIVVTEELPMIADTNTSPKKSPEKCSAKCETEKDSSSKIEKKLDCYNGAQYENYSWSQTITELDLQIKIPDKIKSKHLNVEITPTSINITSKIEKNVYLSGEFSRKCKPQETLWSLNDGILQVHLEKAGECWWDCLLTSEPRLNLNKMDCSRPFHELSEEAQAKIEELQWNQERKRQGLPTSDQLELEKTLRKAWNAEGSPFSGEYDPSLVKLN